MNNDKNHPSREEFEEVITDKLKGVITKAKQVRESVRLLEQDVTAKEEKIRAYQNTFEEMKKELVKVQAKLYTGGTV